MSRACATCGHPDRKAIDAALVAGEDAQDVARRFGLGGRAVRRHRAAHLRTVLAEAQEVREILTVEAFLQRVQELEGKVDRVLVRAESEDDLALVLRAIREARENVALLGKLTGDLSNGVTVQVAAFLTSPDFLRVAEKLRNALAPYPAALDAVRKALEA